ncbi:activating signal cointegrator 1 complex subunit 2 [Camellia sinensis]|uniref:activating signal cointegrator 1 complex subunit 2 n=1 Tax=Camellia sinensis TaxID=4442 RepID=UPI001035C184|nr:activating signal cointegrator 1 complex subunit 2 [Camellia sinensis]
MSNRYAQNRSDGKKQQQQQKKFVAKSSTRTTNTPNSKTPQTEPTTLSNSLRQSDYASTRNLVSGGNFVNYLPQDEAVAAGLPPDKGGLDPVESQRVVDHLNTHLSRLLRLCPRDFWTQVVSDHSLHNFLESFLQFRSRWYDFPYRGVKGIVAGVIVGEFELSRRLFMVLYRICATPSVVHDLESPVADLPIEILVLGLLIVSVQTTTQEKKLLDMPKLLDICAIYGHENEDLTRSLVVNALKAQPSIHDSFIAALSHFLKIVHTMHQRCSASLEVLFSSHGHEDHGSSQLCADYLEVMDFINDAIVSMDAFVSAYKPAAVFFSCPVEMSFGNEELLSTLARLHDSLLPSLQRGFRIIFTTGEDGLQGTNGDMLSNITLSLKMLSMRIVKFGWNLLDVCYLSDEVFEGSFPLPVVTKMFPAKVEDPVIRADILVQTFREISGGYSYAQEGWGWATFFQNVEKKHKIMERVEFLQSTGWVLMDDEQFQYLSGITKHPLEANTKEIPHVPTSLTNKKLQVDEDTAIVESKISQIRDLFPDYGRGFLSACLEVYNQNPEEVIQRILEGTLHEDLQSLDPSLETIPPPKSTSVSSNDKGKGKLFEPMPPPPSTNVAPTITDRRTVGPSLSSSSSSVGRFVRKSKVTSSDSAALDSRDEKVLAKTAGLISQLQLEYEDEYDDSFDDLGLSVADSGVEETEILGEKINSNRGKSWETDAGSSAPSAANSKWNSRKKPQFFVKDGKNYSYKVADSVAVSNYDEATLVNQAQRELIHGLGRGGNLPLGAVKRLTESNEEQEGETDVTEVGGRGNSRGRGRRGGGGGRNHYRKDRALKKHFTGLTGN